MSGCLLAPKPASPFWARECRRARWQYDPSSGRFLQRDPFALRLTDPPVSSYFYANDEPTLYTDPSGLCWTGLCWAKHAGQWAERHPHVVVDAAAAVCVVASLGGCGYVAVGAVVTTIVAVGLS